MMLNTLPIHGIAIFSILNAVAVTSLTLQNLQRFGRIHTSSFANLKASLSILPEIDNPNNLSRARFTSIFDFSNPETVDSFERIDDAIMGGISTSSIRHVPALGTVCNSSSYASWSGICRVDGGGFCGTRTLPFLEPLLVNSDAQGFYIDCRLVSDHEPSRRVWKMSTRTDQSRGEQLYQAEFTMPEGAEEWSRIPIPFSNFQMVRGARFVPNGEVMNVTAQGIFQIGLTLSKFRSAQNMTVIDSFRPGFFEVQIKNIGVYSNALEEDGVLHVLSPDSSLDPPRTLAKHEVEKNRPLPVKILLPLSKLFFSEQANRRRSAMKILRTQRGMSRLKAILFGIGVRSKKSGIAMAMMQALTILIMDTFRSISGVLLKYGLLAPLRLVAKWKNATKTTIPKPVSQTAAR